MIEKYSGKSNAGNKRKSTVSLHSRLGLIDNLKTTVEGLRWNRKPSTWTGYYEGDSYTPDALGDKARLTQQFLKQVQPGSVWDLGANTGRFSRLASEMGIQTVAFDQDPAVVEGCYQTMRKQEDSNLLPLVMDLANPSPPIGWANRERLDLAQRGPVDMVLALALIHHLAIANNVPFRMIAKYFKSITRWALVEFVPRTDPKAMLLMETRQDSFEDYTQERFEDDFGALFRIEATVPIAGSERLLYLLKSR
jgi:SAM-dependent methyltransferase